LGEGTEDFAEEGPVSMPVWLQRALTIWPSQRAGGTAHALHVYVAKTLVYGGLKREGLQQDGTTAGSPGKGGRGETWDLMKIFWPKPSLFLDQWH